MTAVWLALVPAGALGVHLRGTILHVGYRGSASNEADKGSHYYRVGEWTPILVELINDDPDRFEGRIEVRERDRDGDEVVSRRDVVVQGRRQFFLYVPGGRFEQQLRRRQDSPACPMARRYAAGCCRPWSCGNKNWATRNWRYSWCR